MPSPDNSENHENGLLLVVSGPSGVGKTTITRFLIDRLDAVFSVSLTTRKKTAADVEGRDYHFVSTEEFQRAIADDELLEHACVFNRDYYGTPRRAVNEALAAGRIMILEIDVQGAIQVRESMPEAFLVFILPPDDETLLRRLRQRGRESIADIDRRFQEARNEIALAHSSGAYDAFVVNESVDAAVDSVCKLVRNRLEIRCR